MEKERISAVVDKPFKKKLEDLAKKQRWTLSVTVTVLLEEALKARSGKTK